MAWIGSALRIILLLIGSIAAFLLAYLVIGMMAFLFWPFGLVLLPLLVGAYFLIGRWVLRRL